MAKRPLATVRDVADYFGVPIKTVYEWNSRGSGPRPHKVGRHVRYRWDDVEKWLDDHADGGTAA